MLYEKLAIFPSISMNAIPEGCSSQRPSRKLWETDASDFVQLYVIPKMVLIYNTLNFPLR